MAVVTVVAVMAMVAVMAVMTVMAMVAVMTMMAMVVIILTGNIHVLISPRCHLRCTELVNAQLLKILFEIIQGVTPPFIKWVESVTGNQQWMKKDDPLWSTPQILRPTNFFPTSFIIMKKMPIVAGPSSILGRYHTGIYG
ncbi:hypothetical protein [Melghirimyces profundicolus]|uniref:hypothetical protein n=1 Tax=Melghirimyces profundicolus TaxID=1242148 RepID=UPI001475608C|nr:hypothetical protein [Melghirimyces profundicolus]